jgi:glycosyltransferase involved in cell wall biosynthesis
LRARGAPLGVQFPGWLSQPQLDRELEAAHVYVSTSKSDSTSVSLLEAMAAGSFPVVSDLPANREWVTDGDTALLFPPGDAAALADRLQRAASDPALRARAATANRTTVRERATWESNMASVEALFVRLAGG